MVTSKKKKGSSLQSGPPLLLNRFFFSSPKQRLVTFGVLWGGGVGSRSPHPTPLPRYATARGAYSNGNTHLFSNLHSHLCTVVYWIEPLTLDQRVPGSIPVNAWHFLSFSKTLYPHCCSPPRCINGYPVGCERYLLHDVACVHP